jgi:hypothetical protein
MGEAAEAVKAVKAVTEAAEAVEAVDVASAVRVPRQIRGIYPTNSQVISRLIEGLTSGGHIVWVIRCIRETLRTPGLDEWSRAECIRFVETHLRANGIAAPTPRGRVSGEEMLKLATDQKHTDTTIEVTGPDGRTKRTFHAHACVLIANSVHFKTRLVFDENVPLLYDNAGADVSGVLRIEMMEPAVFDLVLRFIYTGSLTPPFPSIPFIGPDVLASLVLAADMYVVAGLVRECADFIDPTNALVVMKTAERVDTEETDMLVETCASVLVHSAEYLEDPRALVGTADRVVYAIAAQLMSSVHCIHRDSLKSTIRSVWDAVRAWHGGASLLEIQASLIENGTPVGMLIAPYRGKSFVLDADATSTTVFGYKYDVKLKGDSGRRVIEVRAHDAKYSTSDSNAASSMAYLVASSPKLVTVSTDRGSRAHAVLSCDRGCIVLAVDDGPTLGTVTVTVEVNPIFSLITAAAALGLTECTTEFVQGLHPDVLHCILRSKYTSCDPLSALRALAARDDRADRDEIVRALTDKLADVPVGQLLDVLDDVPSLGLIDSFSRLLVSRLVSADVTAEDREIALVGLIKRACAAHAATQVSGDTDRNQSQPTEGDGDDIDSPEPDSKVARLA